MMLFITILIISIVTHIVRTVYEFLKINNKIDPEKKFVFPAIFLNMLILWVTWFILGFADPFKILLPGYIRYPGIGIFGIGMVLFVWSLAQIKRFENYHGDLITGGIYKYFRHPMYLAFILWMVGSSLFCQSGTSMVMTIIYSANIYVWKRIEEIQLKRTFPHYKEYMGRTWF